MGGKSYRLLHVIGHKSEVFGKPGIAVLASDRPFNIEAIKKSLLDNKGNADVSSRQPYVKVQFDEAGKAKSFYATAGGFTTNASGDGLSGEIKVDGQHVTGVATLKSQGEGDLQRSFDFRFAADLIDSASPSAQPAAPLAKLGVSGTFKGNGKDARLAFVSARPRDPFADKPSLMLIFTERDHSRDPRPDVRAAFGDYGSAIIVSCHEDGDIFGCEVAHAAHPKKPFSSSGKIEMHEFQIAGGQVQGRLTTGGEASAFDQTWEVDLRFAAPYKAADTLATNSSRRNSSSPNRSAKAAAPGSSQPESKPTVPQNAGNSAAAMNVKELAILRGVENVEYKALVEQIGFKSERDYKSLAAELAKKLDAQGWKKEDSDLIGVSAILKRKLGNARLTIFVKPAAGGSHVTIMSEGLKWDP